MGLFISDDFDDRLRELKENKNVQVLVNGEPPSYFNTYELPYDITYKAINGYELVDVSGGGYNPITDEFNPSFNINDDNLTAKASFNSSDFDINSYSVSSKQGESKDFIVTEELLTDVADNSGLLKINDTDVKAGDYFNYPFVMKIVSNDDDVIFVSVTGTYSPALDEYQTFTLSEDKKTASYTFTKSDQYSFITITSDVITTDVKGYNDVYLLGDEQVREIIDNAYGRQIGNEFQGTDEYLDYREYIIGLLDIPFDIPEDIKAGKSKVKLGNRQTDINAIVLSSDQLTVDMGSITYTATDSNSYDYMGVTCNLHLPFSEPIVIDPYYVVNETIRIEYVINLVDGSTFINIYSSKIEDVVLSRKIELYCNIPFRIMPTNPSKNEPDNVNYGNKNGVLTPYVEVLKNKEVLPYGFFTIPIVDETEIKNVNGYVEVDNVVLKGNISNNDQNELINLLNKGVIINV